jgi:hypothetical protein
MGRNTKLWYGYLEAGEKSSHIAMDSTMDTGKPKTVYVFNLKRDQILEYSREIIEPKLRELHESEFDMLAELKKAFNKARKAFTPRKSYDLKLDASTGAGTKQLDDTPYIPDDVEDIDINLGEAIELEDEE